MRWLVVVALLLFPSLVNAASFKFEDESPSTVAIYMDGVIVDGDNFALSALLRKIPSNKSKVMYLSGPGGKFSEVTKLGGLVRDNDIRTIAVNECASSCAYVWLAGSKIGVYQGSKVRFHSVSLSDGKTKEISAQGNAILGAYLAILGYDMDLVMYVSSVDLDKMITMTYNDSRVLGLNVDYISNPNDVLNFAK